MRFKRTLSDCKNCPLRDRKRVLGMNEIDKPSIVVLGEAPGEVEDTEGKPFVGPAGRLLMGKCFEAGIMWKGVHRMNVINCRPANNVITSSEAQEAIECCRPGFLEELAAVKKLGGKVVIPLGNTAATALGIPSNISRTRGSVYQVHGYVAVPTYHPSFILRGAWSEEPTWVADLRKAKDISLKNWKPVKEKFNIFPKLADVEGFADDAVAKKRTIGVDIEGFKKILMIGLSKSASEVLVVPFMKQGGGAYWKPAEELRVRKAVDRILRNCPTIYQNAQFDVYALESQGYTVGNIAHDTMILSHSIHPELSHKLGYIVSIYGETPYWKDVVLQSDEQAGNLPDDDFRTYNARDAAVLHQVLKPMLVDLADVGTGNTYNNFGMKLLRPLMAMKRRGVLVDQKRLASCQRKFKASAEKLHRKIFTLLDLPEDFNLDSDDQLRFLLHGKIPKGYYNAKKELEEYDVNPRKKKDSIKYRTLTAKVHLYETVTPLRTTQPRVRRTDSGMESCDDAAVLTIQRGAINRLEAMESLIKLQPRHMEEQAELNRTLEFIALFRKWSEDHKLATTYSKYPIGPDGRIHANYKIHGTATGRLSSSDPNMQNQPAEVQSVFVVPDGMVMIKADYSNIEVRVMAYLSDEPVLIEALESGVNIHDLNTRIMFGIEKSDPNWDTIRRAAKIFVFGRSYGGTVSGIYQEVITQVPEARLSLSKFKEADERYFAKLTHYAEWCEKQRKIARDTRTVMTAFGRKRFLLGTEDEIERQALNCVDYETKALTRSGWKSGLDIKVGEEILTKDATTGELIWSAVKDVKNYPDVDTPVVKFTHRNLSAVTTFDHRWLVTDKNSSKDRCVTTDKMSRFGDHRIHRTGKYRGANEAVLRDDDVRFLGWILTDGNFKKGTNGTTAITIMQSPWGNASKAEAIDDMIKRLGVYCKVYDNKYPGCRTWTISGEYALRVRALVPDRVLSWDLLNILTSEQAVILWNTMIDGDGTRDHNGRVRFIARDSRRAEMFQILTTMVGLHATYKWRDMTKYKPKVQGRMRNSPRMTGCYVVDVLTRAHTQILAKDREVTIAHGVWCPIVETTYFVAMRAGTVYITGNTPTQGTAGEIAEMAIIECYDKFQANKAWDAHLIATVHDSILVECNKRQAMTVAKAMKKIMEKKITINGHTVTFPVDIEIGPSWGETEKVEIK